MIIFTSTFAVACSSAPERDTTKFCSAYVDVARRGAKLADPDDVSLATLRSQVGDIDEAASDAAQRAPKDIADTVDSVITPLHELRKNLDDADGRAPATRALRQYRSRAAKITTEQRRLDAWVATNCGVVPVTSTTIPVTIHPSATG